jgi:putative holliday junction resolvase
MGVDPGSRRVGVALSNPEATIALPLEVIERDAGDSYLDRLQELATEHAVTALVLGLPIRMDGSEGPAAANVRELAAALGRRLSIPIHFVDERLTSRQAETAMAAGGLNSRKRRGRVDRVAATLILQGFLDTARN